jgi:fatty acid desaturase
LVVEELDRQAIIRVRQQLAPWFKPKAWIYWSDMLMSAALGWGTFALALRASSRSSAAVYLIVSMFALYRVLAFTHELEHQANGVAPGFRGVWHVLVGMPFCLPHFVYRNVHRIHHSKRYYGTPADPEYIPFVAQRSFKHPILMTVLALLFPIIVALRYLVLVPVAVFSRRLRTWLDTKASAFTLVLDYSRVVTEGKERSLQRVEEFSTTLCVWSIVILVAYNQLPALALAYWYLVFAGFMLANALRGLAATHRYESNGEVMPFDLHIYDSVNLERLSLLNELVCPLGLSLHATHHIFPTLPYYALRRAHRDLMEETRAEGQPLRFYSSGQWSHLFPALGKIWRAIRTGRTEDTLSLRADLAAQGRQSEHADAIVDDLA